MKDWLSAAKPVLFVLLVMVLAGMAGTYLGTREKAAVQQDRAQQTAAVTTKVAEVDRKVLPQHTAAQERIRYVTKEIIREVPVYVPAGACALPPGWRVLHDAAAAGEVPDPTGIPDAAPVAPDQAASTVAANYGACHENAEQLRALQQWLRGVTE